MNDVVDEIMDRLEVRVAELRSEAAHLEAVLVVLRNGNVPPVKKVRAKTKRPVSKPSVVDESFVDYLAGDPRTAAEVAAQFDITPQAARYRLERLVSKKVARRRKTQRGLVWSVASSPTSAASPPSSS